MKKMKLWLAAGVSALVLLAVLVAFSDALAQPSGKTQKDGSPQTVGVAGSGQRGGGGGFGGGGGGFGGGGQGGGGFGGGGFGGGSVAANAEYVYVLQNNTLFQFAANDLKAIKSVPLEGAPAVPAK